jgi:hypothetical protein
MGEELRNTPRFQAIVLEHRIRFWESICACLVQEGNHYLEEVREFLATRVRKTNSGRCVHEGVPQASGGVKLNKYGAGGVLNWHLGIRIRRQEEMKCLQKYEVNGGDERISIYDDLYKRNSTPGAMRSGGGSAPGLVATDENHRPPSGDLGSTVIYEQMKRLLEIAGEA